MFINFINVFTVKIHFYSVYQFYKQIVYCVYSWLYGSILWFGVYGILEGALSHCRIVVLWLIWTYCAGFWKGDYSTLRQRENVPSSIPCEWVVAASNSFVSGISRPACQLVQVQEVYHLRETHEYWYDAGKSRNITLGLKSF